MNNLYVKVINDFLYARTEPSHLTLGKIYKVLKIYDGNTEFQIINDIGKRKWYVARRFELLDWKDKFEEAING